MIWRSFRVGGWIHAMEFDHESKGYKLLVTVSGTYGHTKVTPENENLAYIIPSNTRIRDTRFEIRPTLNLPIDALLDC